MAAKWRAQQRKQRWEHSAVLLPPSILASLTICHSLRGFSDALRQWNALPNTYEQVSGAKQLVDALSKCRSSPFFHNALAAYVEVLFQDGSKPVHRTMLSPIAGYCHCEPLLCDVFYQCCSDYGSGGCKERRFALVSIGLSLANLPKPGVLSKVVGRCSRLIAFSASLDVADVLKRAESGENPTPALMEECQDAMSTLYYMLQRSSDRFTDEGDSVYAQVVATSLDVLQTSFMSRDCVVAAAVCLCAAAQVNISSRELATMASSALFPGSTQEKVEAALVLEQAIRKVRGTDLSSEASRLTAFGRLCVLRGLLTSIPRETLNMCLKRRGDAGIWILLFDGVLPAICQACESSFDSHFKFHAVTALQICLQQVKASMMDDVTAAALRDAGISGDYNPFPSGMTSRVMQIVWNNWEDPLNQTVKQVQMVFDLLADLQPYVLHDGSTEMFLRRVASDLLAVGGHRKGRYVPLASIGLRLGAQKLLEMCPLLLFQTTQAMADDGVCCAASSFLKVMLERLREEFWSTHGVAYGYLQFRRLWVPPMLAGLVAGNARLRTNLQTYALPVGLEIDGDILLQMIGFVLDGTPSRNIPSWEDLRDAAGMPGALSPNQRVAALVSLIKVARSLALMDNEIKTSSKDANLMELSIKGVTLYAPVMLLELALSHIEDGLRVDAAEIVCLNPKTAVMPSPLELHLLRLAVPLNMRCSSTAFRMKWTSLLKKFFSRVRTATERQAKLSLRNQVVEEETQDGAGGLDRPVASLEKMQEFMRWLARLLISSLYPSAPYERKYMAMEIYNVMLDVWSPSEESRHFSPYGKEVLSAGYTSILLGSAVDSWDRLRESAFKILIRYPTPIPGVATEQAVNRAVSWGKELANSPRVRESDAGALILRMIFRKYVCEQRWRVTLHPFPSSSSDVAQGDEIVQFFEALNDWLEAGVTEGEKDLMKACKQSLVHGVLLTYRYAITELDWISEAVRANIAGLRAAFERLFKLLLRVTSLALWVVSADALKLHAKQFVDDEDEDEEDSFDNEEDDDGDTELLAPAEQMIMVACWLSMKEVSLLLGSIARGAPLPGCSFNARSKPLNGDHVLDEQPFVLLEPQQLEAIGQHFLQVLLAVKHNGAIDKTRAGFIALCNRLLLSSDTRLSKMPELWMQQLMARTVANGQSLDDLLRRSAGIPASFIALFLSEPDGAPRKLLPAGMAWLLDNIKQFNERGTKDTGDVVPVVHAFNTLRVTFNDTNLSTETSGFCAEGLIVAIRAFSSPYWQVRNSATLAFTALLHRTVGFLNVHKDATARRAITGFEFFNRYPALHPFLLKELQTASLQLDEDNNKIGLTQSRLHPSLAPVLVVLSRLRPSIVNTRADDWLGPSAFMPYVRRCAMQCNLKVRALASRALAPLVTPESLSPVLLELSEALQQLDARSYNSVHGVLLQLSSLLRNNCPEISDREKQRDLVERVFGKLRDCTWLGSIRSCSCFIVVEAFLRVLEDLVHLATPSSVSIQPVLLRLCADNMASRSAPTWDSTQVTLRATAVRVYFSSILQAWLSANLQANEYASLESVRSGMQAVEKSVEFAALLEEAVSDTMYEVRLAALKSLKAVSSEGVAGLRWSSSGGEFVQQDARKLQSLLVGRLRVEEQPRCVKRVLEMLLRWDLLGAGSQELEDDDGVELWDTLYGIYSKSKVAKTREYAVRCLGDCLRRVRASLKAELIEKKATEATSLRRLRCVMDAWMQLIEEHGAASEPVTIRRALAAAIVASESLEDAAWLSKLGTTEATRWYSSLVVSVWCYAIKLLEDEDVSLRQQLSLAMQMVIGRLSACVPAQVEKVLETCLEFLRLQLFGNGVLYAEFLAEWIIGGRNKQQAAELRGSDLVRRLFDKELDNHHEEELLVVQQSCLQMNRFLVETGTEPQRDEFVVRWRRRFLEEASSCATWCEELQRSKHYWVGGVTNHPDVFRSLYRTLLGLLAVAVPVLSDAAVTSASFIALLNLLSRLPLNPMVSNLALRTAAEYERCLGVDCGRAAFEASVVADCCPEFEPLFLVR